MSLWVSSKIFLLFNSFLTYIVCVRGMPQVHIYVTKQTEWSHDASIEKYCNKRRKMVFFWISYPFSSYIQRKSTKKRVFPNHFTLFEGLQIFFYRFLTCIVCVWGMPQVHSYVTKQTGWSHDASIDKNCSKRKQTVFLFDFIPIQSQYLTVPNL